jgi:hypothetical protein
MPGICGKLKSPKMKTTASILVLLTIILFSCKKNSSVDTTATTVNLIANPSFETADHQISYNGWTGTVYLIDSLGVKHPPIIKDAPTGGGLWCLQLVPGWLPEEGFSETSVTGQTGTNIYKVTVWMKTITSGGLFSLEQWRNGQRIKDKSVIDTASIWKQLSLSDTLTVLSTDTLKVHLSAGSTELISRRVYFDLIKLERINQ